MTNSKRKLKMYVYSCFWCSHIFRWIDERKPNYCPECGGSSNRFMKDPEEMFLKLEVKEIELPE